MLSEQTPVQVKVTQEIEALAQFLHDEGGFGDAWDNHTWPEHRDDTGQRDGGWVKIVPSDVQAQFREVATRLHRSFLATHWEAAERRVVEWLRAIDGGGMAELYAKALAENIEAGHHIQENSNGE